MNETDKNAPAETGSKEVRVQPERFQEPSLLDSFLWDFDRMFDPLRRGFWRSPLSRMGSEFEPFRRSGAGSALTPVVDIVENDKAYEMKVELPGIDPNNVELKFANGVLMIRGEKKEEKEEKNENYYLSERRFGSFQRSFSMPANVDTDHIEAKFDKGVLAIRLPKTAAAIESEKKIAIQTR
jgi:HSP20 family protein